MILMESKVNKYEQYKNDSSNDEFIDSIDGEGIHYFLGYLFETTPEQRRMFQGIIKEYFYKGAEKPLKKLAADIGPKFIFGDSDQDTEIKFLAYLATYQATSYGLFTKDKNGNKREYNEYGLLLPEKNRVFFDPKKGELGFDFDTASDLYRNLKLGQRKFYVSERDQITMMFDKFYEFPDIRYKTYDFVINALKNHDLDDHFLHVIDHIIGNDCIGMIQDEDKILNVLGYLKKDQKIDCEFIRLFIRSFNLEADKNKKIRIKLMQHFDDNIDFNELFRFVGIGWDSEERVFFDPEIIPKDQMKRIINNLKGQRKRDKDGNKNKIRINTFFKVQGCLKKYNDKELVNYFRAACKNKINLETEGNIVDADEYFDKFKFVILNPELLDNKNFKKLMRRLLGSRIDLLKDQDAKNKKILLRADSYYDLKENLEMREIHDKEMIYLFNQLEPRFNNANFEDIKSCHPEEFQAFCEDLKDRLERLKKTVEFVEADSEHLEKITGELKEIVEIAPLSKTQKDKLNTKLENIELSDAREKIIEILDIIKDIFLFRISKGLEKIKNFGKRKIFSAFSKIKNALPATEMKRSNKNKGRLLN